MQSIINISQSHLNLLENCPLKFQQKYLEKVNLSGDSALKKQAQWGKLFHLIMQQINLGLNVDLLGIDNQELIDSVKLLIKETSDIWDSNPTKRESEDQLNLIFNNYLLVVIYDLLVCYENKAIIYDWKTYLQRDNLEKIEKNWQTRLYLYVLAEKFNYQPDDISMIYWFIKLPSKPQKITVNYNQEKHQKTKQDLLIILEKLNLYLTNYYQNNQSFCDANHSCHKNCTFFEELKFNQQQEIDINLKQLIDLQQFQEIII